MATKISQLFNHLNKTLETYPTKNSLTDTTYKTKTGDNWITITLNTTLGTSKTTYFLTNPNKTKTNNTTHETKQGLYEEDEEYPEIKYYFHNKPEFEDDIQHKFINNTKNSKTTNFNTIGETLNKKLLTFEEAMFYYNFYRTNDNTDDTHLNEYLKDPYGSKHFEELDEHMKALNVLALYEATNPVTTQTT